MAKTRTDARTQRPTPLVESGFQVTAGMAAAIFFGLAFVYFLPALLPGRGIFGTDYLAGGYPFSEFIAGRLKAGELPKWVPHVYGGLPLFANAGSTYYPVWLIAAFLLPVALILPVLFVVQFALAGFGMFLLLRELGARGWVAVAGGLAFQFTGLTMSYVYAGHDGRVIVATLAPLFLFFLHRIVRTGGIGAAVGAAATLAFALLSFQIQSNYYLLLAGLAWGVFLLIADKVRGRALAGRLALGFGAVAVAFVLNAVNFLPFLDYVDQSPRGGEEGRGYEYATSWAMPPAEITALAIPELAGVSVQDPNTGEALFPEYRGENAFKLHTEYVGGFVLLLVGLGAWYARRDRYWWFFVGLALFALTISFGGHTPIYRLYYELLPGTKRFRAPSISFFLVSLSLVAMAGLALEHLARVRDEVDRRRLLTDPLAAGRWLTLGAGALALVLIVAGGAVAPEGAAGVETGFARFALFLALSAAVVWLWLTGRMGARLAGTALAVVVVADLWVIGRRFFHTVPPPEVWFRADDVADALRSQPGHGRAWVLSIPGVPSYHGTGNYLMLHDIDQAGGEHPNPLQRWYEYVGPGERSYVDWHNFLDGEAAFLHAANVRWIVSMARLEGAPQFPAVRLIHPGPSALVYENTDALPRAYLVGDVRVVDARDGAIEILRQPGFDPRLQAVVQEPPDARLTPGPVAGEATILEDEPDRIRIRVRTDRPAFLVLADNYYEGWTAQVDGAPVTVHRTNHTFRGVPVPAGEHEVEFRFRPGDLYTGFLVYALGMLLLAGYAGYALFRRRRAGAPE